MTQELHHHTVSTAKVAVLDGEEASSQKLAIKLQFIGESASVFTPGESDALLQALGGGEYFALLAGNLTPHELTAVLDCLELHGVDIALLLASDTVAADALSEYWRPRVLGAWARPVAYGKLVEGLNEARQQAGLKRQDFDSVLMSDTGSPLFRGLVGDSFEMRQLRATIESLKNELITVLLSGEPGSGMEIVARNLHYASGRHGKPFVAVSCASLGRSTAIEELFGCEAGYQGQLTPRTGLLGRANGGTLYLDSVEDLPEEAQARLVGFLQNGMFERLGARAPQHADVRVIAGTHEVLSRKAAAREFRTDLYYLLNVFPIPVPPLRRRIEDLPDLVNELVSRLQHRDRSPVVFEYDALQSLQKHH